MPRKPLTVAELRAHADAGLLTAEDLQQIRWMRSARRIWVPDTDAELFCAELGEAVRAYREKKGLSALDLGSIFGIHQSYIRRLENGFITNITIANAIRLASAIEMRVELKLKRKRHAPKTKS